MSKIPVVTVPANLQGSKAHIKASAVAGFDALLTSKTSSNQFIDSFLEHITSSLNNNSSGTESYKFPLTAAFESTFGPSGPLPSFINKVSASLGLTQEQNSAFQQIAVNNKDATKTPASMQKIAAELKAAGINY